MRMFRNALVLSLILTVFFVSTGCSSSSDLVSFFKQKGFNLVDTIEQNGQKIYRFVNKDNSLHTAMIVYKGNQLFYIMESFPISLNQMNQGITVAVLNGYKPFKESIKDQDGVVTAFYKDNPSGDVKREVLGYKQTFTGQYYQMIYHYYMLEK